MGVFYCDSSWRRRKAGEAAVVEAIVGLAAAPAAGQAAAAVVCWISGRLMISL